MGYLYLNLLPIVGAIQSQRWRSRHVSFHPQSRGPADDPCRGGDPDGHHGCPPVPRPVRRTDERIDRAGHRHHQPGAGGGPVHLGGHAAGGRRGRRPLRSARRADRRPGGAGHRLRAHTLHDLRHRPHRVARPALGDGRRRRQLFRADRGGGTAHADRGARHRLRRHQCRRLARSVRVRAHHAKADQQLRLDGGHVVARAADADRAAPGRQADPSRGPRRQSMPKSTRG
jgi:hypothetical protein